MLNHAGKEHTDENFEHKPISGESIIVFGQDQDGYKGGFDPQQMFSGEIAAFEITEKILGQEEMADLATCKSALIGGEVVFTTENIEDPDWELSKVNITDQEDVNFFCQHDSLDNIAAIEGDKDFDEVNETCSVMGGRIPSLMDFSKDGHEGPSEIIDKLLKLFQVNK